ncbi:C2 domain-containing protein [Syncephalis fuscata]|nr:C2 domain-containing protein [Syncephalis fuscata]
MVSIHIHLMNATNLAPKDSNGLSDPVICRYSIWSSKHQSKTIKKTLDPVWNEVFELPIKPGRMTPAINVTIWDKDTIGRDYMGEITIPLQHLFTRNCPTPSHDEGHPLDINDPRNQPVWYNVYSSKEEQVSGSICIKAGLSDEGRTHSDEEWENLWYNTCIEANRNK